MKMACSACPSSARSYAKNSKSNQLEVVINGDRRVVAERLVPVDRAAAGGGCHGRCRQVVVNRTKNLQLDRCVRRLRSAEGQF